MYDSPTGFVELWRNGDKLVDWNHTGTAYNDDTPPYFKFGIYASGWGDHPRPPPANASGNTVVYGGIKQGDASSSYHEVDTSGKERLHSRFESSSSGTEVDAAVAATDDACVNMPHTELTSIPLKTYDGVWNPKACCKLCQEENGCQAWTIKTVLLGESTCRLHSSTVGQNRGPRAPPVNSGRLIDAATHFTSPYDIPGCLSDEVVYRADPVRSVEVCAPACMIAGTSMASSSSSSSSSLPVAASAPAFCPADVPNGIQASPECVLRDPYTNSNLCGLVCTADAECQGDFSRGVCAGNATVAGVKVCVYNLFPV